jgi:hypothetical protein
MSNICTGYNVNSELFAKEMLLPFVNPFAD